ncbi:MAG: hypothetical protein PHW75_01835 [Patescibacteria group bacterium]|nr:hypothetical protein [Patescibacteria group bacterium]
MATIQEITFSARVWPLVFLLGMGLFRLLTYKETKGEDQITKKASLFISRGWFVLKVILVVFSIPAFGRALNYINIEASRAISQESGIITVSGLLKYLFGL